MSEEDLFLTPGSIFNPDRGLKAEPASGKCKGIIARANVSQGFIQRDNSGTRGFYFRLQLNILKKKSCPGCAKCDWFWNCCQEVNAEDWPIEDFENIEHGKLYRIDGCGAPDVRNSIFPDDNGDFHLCVVPYTE